MSLSNESFLVRVSPVVKELLSANERVQLVKNVIAFYIVTKWLVKTLSEIVQFGPIGYLKEWKKSLLVFFFRHVKRIPYIKAQVDSELGKVLVKIEHEVAPKKEGETRFLRLPSKGQNKEQLDQLIKIYEDMTKVNYLDGKVSGTVYHGGQELTEVILDAYKRFSWSNPLHPDVFPGVRKMEAEVVAMVANMFNGGKDACGTMTSGGTESILMACKTMRDWAYDTKGITEPEMVVPVTAHAAFDKAAHYFGIKLIHAPLDEATGKVNLKAVRRLVSGNTIMIAGSAPSYPHGVIDDIQGLAKIALKYNIGLHVDSCLGGFLVPFMDEAGFPLAPFDFRVKGVTSISCDTHKYGFAPKGSSVVLYSSRALRQYQYFVAPNWPGGIYGSPSIAGSRPGALIAGCWAAMMHMGREGYVQSTKEIVGAARFIAQEVRKVNGLKVYGNPEVSVVGIGSDYFDIYILSAELSKRGWNLNNLQYPASIHICCTQLTVKVKDTLVKDIKEITEVLMINPQKKGEGDAAIYGLAAAIPDRSLVEGIAKGYIDAMYSAE